MGERGSKAKPSCTRRWRPSGSGRGGLGRPPVRGRTADAAISADTVWQVPASPPRQLRQLQRPNNGDLNTPPPRILSKYLLSTGEMSFSGGTERAALAEGCRSHSPATVLKTTLPGSQVP